MTNKTDPTTPGGCHLMHGHIRPCGAPDCWMLMVGDIEPEDGGCSFCGGTGIEWSDYWSQDEEPCRKGCGDPLPEGEAT